jgi:proteasome lid subunit RPN8/RPN11
MRHPQIIVDQRLLRGFRKRALEAYPKEHLESIWGKIDGLNLKIYSIHPYEKEHATGSSVTVSGKHVDEDQDEANENGLQVLGGIHTHPGLPGEGAAPSEQDWSDAREHNELLIGICGIHKNKTRRSTRIRFYLAQKPVEVKR